MKRLVLTLTAYTSARAFYHTFTKSIPVLITSQSRVTRTSKRIQPFNQHALHFFSSPDGTQSANGYGTANLPDSFSLKGSWKVNANETGLRLSNFLTIIAASEFPSDTSSKKAIRRGMLYVNGVKTKEHILPLKVGDSIQYYIRTSQADYTRFTNKVDLTISDNKKKYLVDVLWEDDHCAVVVKPQGMPVFAGNIKINRREEAAAAPSEENEEELSTSNSSDGSSSTISLQTALIYSLKPVPVDTSSSPTTSGDTHLNTVKLEILRRPQPVHRLDKGTGGLLLVAKTKSALADLTSQFANRSIEKRYLALTAGKLEMRRTIRPDPDSSKKKESFIAAANSAGGEVSRSIVIQEGLSDGEIQVEKGAKKGFISISLSGQEAVTEYQVRDNMHTRSSLYGYVTTVDLYPHTGRTHQLRRHLDMIGHPILGDPDYWFGDGGRIFAQKTTAAMSTDDTSVTATRAKDAGDIRKQEEEEEEEDNRIPPPPRFKGWGMFLWSVGISFTHPVSRERIEITLPEPESFSLARKFLEELVP